MVKLETVVHEIWYFMVQYSENPYDECNVGEIDQFSDMSAVISGKFIDKWNKIDDVMYSVEKSNIINFNLALQASTG